MRSEAQFLSEYAKSHQNRTNQIVHMICVPVIFWATLGLFWLIPLASLLPIPASLASYAHLINAATVGSIAIMLFYARLSLWSFLTGLIWLAISFAIIMLMERAGIALLPVFIITWVVAWAGQFWGHKVEGAKPSFADDVMFLLIGPLFVQQKLQKGF